MIPFDKESPYDISTGGHGRKKVLIFSSKGGGGHISAMNALTEYLKEDYIIGTSFIFSDVLAKFDPIQQLTFGKKTGEDLYNFFIKKKWHLPINLTMSDFGPWLYNINRRKIEAVLEKYLSTHKPDLIISVIPVINHLILNVAKKLDLPFLLIPTDLDPTIALSGIRKPKYDKFYLALSYDEPDIRKKIAIAQIPEKQIDFVGFPVKQAFLESHRERIIRKDFNIPAAKPVILLLMGAQGSRDLYDFTKQLSKLQVPAHLLIAIGKSEYLRKSLEKISFPNHITREIIGFTDRMPDLMAVADLFITKSGSVSVNEAIYSNLPILLDATSTLIKWEKFNHKFIKSHGFGDIIKRYHAIQEMVNELFTDDDTKLNEYKKNLEAFDKPNTEEEIQKLVRKILKVN